MHLKDFLNAQLTLRKQDGHKVKASISVLLMSSQNFKNLKRCIMTVQLFLILAQLKYARNLQS